jgi:hypothetical protein
VRASFLSRCTGKLASPCRIALSLCALLVSVVVVLVVFVVLVVMVALVVVGGGLLLLHGAWPSCVPARPPACVRILCNNNNNNNNSSNNNNNAKPRRGVHATECAPVQGDRACLEERKEAEQTIRPGEDQELFPATVGCVASKTSLPFRDALQRRVTPDADIHSCFAVKSF